MLTPAPPPPIVAVSVPKRRRKIKELNNKETVGDLLDAFKEVREQKVAEEEGLSLGMEQWSHCNQNGISQQWLQVNPGVPEVENQPPLENNPSPEPEGNSVPLQPAETDETWDSKEDKIQNAENIQPAEQKYEYKSGMPKEGMERAEYSDQGLRRDHWD